MIKPKLVVKATEPYDFIKKNRENIKLKSSEICKRVQIKTDY